MRLRFGKGRTRLRHARRIRGCRSPTVPFQMAAEIQTEPQAARSRLREYRREARLSREGRRRASPWRSQTGSSFSPDVLADGSPLRWREKRQLCLLAHAGSGDGGQDARRSKGNRVEPAAQPLPKCISSTRPPGPCRCLCRQLYCC